MKILTRFAAAIALIGLSSTAFAQMTPNMKLSEFLAKTNGADVPFSAKLDIKVTNKEEKTGVSSCEFSMLDGNFRIAADQDDSLPAQAAAHLQQMGVDKIVTVVRLDKKTVYRVYPNAEAYLQLDMADELAALFKKEPKFEKTELGREDAAGHPCVKHKLTFTDAEGKTQEFEVWSATDLKDFPVQVNFVLGDVKVSCVFKDVALTKPEATSFEVPETYKKYGNLGQLMQNLRLKEILRRAGEKKQKDAEQKNAAPKDEAKPPTP